VGPRKVSGGCLYIYQIKYLNGFPDIGINLEADPGPDTNVHAYIDASYQEFMLTEKVIVVSQSH
jgi:hypothetical protein